MAGDQACCQRILAREFLERLAIDEFLEPDEDLCFCTLCADQRRDFPVSFASEDLVKFSTPLGWYRAGLCVDPQFVEENDVFVDSGGKASGSADKKERTSPAYSGCPSGSSTVTRFNKWMSALELFERKQIFSSPSLAYAGSSLLSPAMPFASSTGCGYYAQACLFVRQAPSHGVGPQSLCSSQGQGLGGECGPCGGSSSSTAGGEGPPCGGAVGPNRIDPNFPNECLEWYTTKWADVLPVALVVRLTPTGVAAARGVSVCMNPSAAGWAAPDRCKKGTNAQLALKEKRLTEKLEEREKAAKGNGRGMMLGDFLRDTVGGGIGGIGSSGWGSGGIPFSETDVLSESFALWDLAFLENRAALALGWVAMWVS
uniref:Uncharacterized protein n=1 Tax=Chromera velia CCMP2878 TaxID=1169474 RepID=A0A0G4G7Z1_9ALVE|eukprot:Cvel_4285.t1-p1 / transcript=Cvel_4285.t1 / gene=Cvel_4285 / organism=Chromera_velia_CCMP2878 / gene_product=hypothetical protein / transcript_product=hypothetical protein / location=Cvel_scaffold186:121-3483(-) / protein_length=370 / sequence_SO=supercontig / SO=protein_coding / is_pseudo=false